jgi:hypothetical protein
VFGPVFDAFTHDVLFVVAAGNSGMRNAATFCPASLAPKYSNVISVGGVNDDGTIGPKNLGSPGSNFGAEYVEMAAPFCTAVMGLQEGVAVIKRQCGTSYAAPRVGNAALRIHARAPWMEPPQMKRLLMRSCDRSDVDVSCGGVLSEKQLERAYAREVRETPPGLAHPAQRIGGGHEG